MGPSQICECPFREPRVFTIAQLCRAFVQPGRGSGFRLHGLRLPGRRAARRPPGGVEGDDGRGAGLAPRAAGGAAAAAEAA